MITPYKTPFKKIKYSLDSAQSQKYEAQSEDITH